MFKFELDDKVLRTIHVELKTPSAVRSFKPFTVIARHEYKGNKFTYEIQNADASLTVNENELVKVSEVVTFINSFCNTAHLDLETTRIVLLEQAKIVNKN